MSPHNLGGKYRCRRHPCSRKCTPQFFCGKQNELIELHPARAASLLGDNVVDHVVCLKAQFLWHAVLSNANGEFYTYDIYPYLNRSVCLLTSRRWIAYLMKFSFCLSGSSPVCWWRDAPLVRISNVRAVRCVSMEAGQPLCDNIYIQFNKFAQQPFHNPLLRVVHNTWLTPVTACGSQSTACGIEMRRGKP